VGVVVGEDVGGNEGYLLGDFDGKVEGYKLGVLVVGNLVGAIDGVTSGRQFSGCY